MFHIEKNVYSLTVDYVFQMLVTFLSVWSVNNLEILNYFIILMDLSGYSGRYVSFCCLYFESIWCIQFQGFCKFPYFRFIFHFWPLKYFRGVFCMLAMFKSVSIIFYPAFLISFCVGRKDFPIITCFPLERQILAIAKESSKTFSFLWKLSLPFVVDLSEQLNLMVKMYNVEVKQVWHQ